MKITYILNTVAIAMSFLLIGCGPKLDGSNSSVLFKSIDAISEKMQPEERRQFRNDLALILKSKGMTLGKYYSTLNGKTVSEVHTRALEVQGEIIRENIINTKNEIKNTSDKIIASDAAKTIIKDFDAKVTGGNLRDLGNYFILIPSFTVTNKTPYQIDRARYNVKVSLRDETNGLIKKNYIQKSRFTPPIKPGDSVEVTEEWGLTGPGMHKPTAYSGIFGTQIDGIEINVIELISGEKKFEISQELDSLQKRLGTLNKELTELESSKVN
ncbi:hypothetical protein [Devosia sp.]|uniref:hypothetical protein n=1 Tax=Devosia sp. TaxID=1871048 RepID=UPI002733CC03|nr:hypothetical protein [Devosia sp.]MDP2780909.1 hypothetical protein [Devosia sp.]